MRNVALLMIILAGCTQTPKEAPKETTKETTEARIPNAEEIALKAYKQAYSHGHNRFMEQIGKTTKAWKYTSSEEEEITEEKLKGLKDEERDAVIEAMSRGYVDGYHSAGESTTCPSFR